MNDAVGCDDAISADSRAGPDEYAASDPGVRAYRDRGYVKALAAHALAKDMPVLLISDRDILADGDPVADLDRLAGN